MKTLGPYDLKGSLGRGGMGTVFRGLHRDTGEIHAVKVLSPTYGADDHFRGRFESEINALLQLDHPNIVKLISYGEEDGNLYFSMELVEGNSLFQMQRKRHSFNWREVLQVAQDVCQGLRHAHDRGIIHRDLKPGNLLMTRFGRVKITDFGIAKSYGTSQNTGDNILGTMDFMSPEQAKGEPVTFRSDLYSLGAVMYTLLCGRPPFSANSIEESLRNLTRVPAPRIGSVVSGVPDELDELIAQLMEKNPKKRIATAMALNHRLGDIETALKFYSEAKTSTPANPKTKSGAESETGDDGRTIKIKREFTQSLDPLNLTIDTNESGGIAGSLGASTRSDKTVVENISVEPPLKKKSTRGNFHNRVEEEDRIAATQRDEDPVESRYGQGILPTLLTLLALVLIATIWTCSALKSPSADQLYSEIQSQPASQAIEQCERYLESYADVDATRTEAVEEIYEFGKATRYYHQLSNRLKAKSAMLGDGRLTEIERQFMEIANLAKSDFEEGNIRMDAFLTIHGPNEGLSDRDRACTEAAKSFRLKIREDARRQAETKLDSISRALERAAGQEDFEAMRTYRSIIMLYGAMSRSENPEVRQMVEQAQAKLRAIESDE